MLFGKLQLNACVLLSLHKFIDLTHNGKQGNIENCTK